MSRATKKRNQRQEAITVYHTVPAEQANTAFVASVQRTDNGANNYLNEFMQVMRDVTARRASFTFADIVTTNRVTFGIPFPELEKLFAAWCEQMASCQKLTTVAGCYDSEIFILN